MLPTAGALITAPTRELWVLLQLVPVAGILNIFLSLGGSITPKDAGDYDLNRPFNYGGMIAKREMVDSYEEMVQEKALLEDVDRSNKEKTRASRFAQQVKRRVTDHSGKGSSAAVWAGLTLQLLLLISMLTAMWYAQLGSIIPWWCRVGAAKYEVDILPTFNICFQVWGWMYFWYFLVVVVSVFDNYFATPFRNTWTLRVSKLPRNLRGISECPSVIEDAGDPCMALDRIERSGGVNSKIWLTVDDAPNDVPKQCFYVLISSQSGVSHWSALIRSMSRGASVTVYAFGTTLFASCQLMCISAALMVLSVVLAAGVLGRIVSMWIVSQLQMGDRKDESPIMHAIVKDRKEASDYVQEIVTIEGIMVEIQGHVLTQGHCIHRGTHGWNRLESYIGLLKGPYDIVGKAIDRPTAPQRRSSGLSRLRSWMTSSGLTKGSNV